jgi:hypothetical protein
MKGSVTFCGKDLKKLGVFEGGLWRSFFIDSSGKIFTTGPNSNYKLGSVDERGGKKEKRNEKT